LSGERWQHTSGMAKRPAEDAHGPPYKMQEAAPRRNTGPKLPVLTYKDTEPLQNLHTYWRSGTMHLLEIMIPPEYMTKDNKRVKARQIWGDHDGYSPDSDVVAVLMHLGHYAHNLTSPPPNVVEVRAHIRLMPPRGVYPSKARFLKSREWVGSAERPQESCCFKVERCWLVTRSAQFVELPPCIDDCPAVQATVQPQSIDRQINTRHTGTTKSRHSHEVSVQFNLCSEPWLKYSLAAIADKGMHQSQLTSARLLHSVLYVETHRNRYQIALQTPAGTPDGKDLYSLARCKSPLPMGLMYKLGMPLPADQVEMYHENVEWEEFNWDVSLLHLRGMELSLKRMNFLPITRPEVKAEQK